MTDDDPQFIEEVWASPPHRAEFLRWTLAGAVAVPVVCQLVARFNGLWLPWWVTLLLAVVGGILTAKKWLEERDRPRLRGADLLSYDPRLALQRRKANRSLEGAQEYLITLERCIRELHSAAPTGVKTRRVRLSSEDIQVLIRDFERERDCIRDHLSRGGAA
jgi:hypothetical protein